MHAVAGLVCLGRVSDLRGQNASASIENPVIAVSLDTADMTLTVADKRTNHTWRQEVGNGR